MNLQNQCIAVLDSGVGGLSIFQAIRQTLPYFSIIYGFDNKNFPYGPKESETVIQCIGDLTQKIIQRFSPDLVVIACNTASTVALEHLRKANSTPIVGVVPAIKPAANYSLSKHIGLLATPGTIRRAYTDQLVREYASDCTVIKVGSTRLVELAEDKLRGRKINLNEIRKEIEPFFQEGQASKIDTIVLGCTHFPLLLEELRSVVPFPIKWIDSSEAIANRVKTLSSNKKDIKPSFEAVFTQLNEQAESLRPHLKTLGFSKISEI